MARRFYYGKDDSVSYPKGSITGVNWTGVVQEPTGLSEFFKLGIPELIEY
jgi:hypothetical protein